MDLDAILLETLKSGASQRSIADLWIITNKRLQRTHTQSQIYDAIERLRGRGLIGVSGDTVRLLNGSPEPPPRPETTPSDRGERAAPLEKDLMAPLQTWIENRFIPEIEARNGSARHKNTSAGGPRKGAWSQPDYTVAAVTRRKYSTLREVELYGFELKKSDATVVAVHEALAHTRWVHYSYLVLHCLDEDDNVQEIEAECARHGIGLVLFADPNVLDTWKIRLRPERMPVEPSRVDEFIEMRLDADQQHLLKTWLTT